MNRRKRPKEFSKKIFIGVAVVNIVLIAFSLYMMYATGDLTPLSYIIPAAAAEMATATGFYYSKAKAENKIKLMKSNGIKPKEEDFGDINSNI
ncbi:MAG: hypothetical protein GX303_09075 [Clostridiales bacterium]|nr:hypothetical protein [Clostridiales bacterium]